MFLGGTKMIKLPRGWASPKVSCCWLSGLGLFRGSSSLVLICSQETKIYLATDVKTPHIRWESTKKGKDNVV